MARAGFWNPFDPEARTAAIPPEIRRAFVMRDEAAAAAMRARLATEAGQREYVEEQLLRLPSDLSATRRQPFGNRILWSLAPRREEADAAGYDLALVPAARLILLTHSNVHAGVWARTRITEGTTANVLELEALVQCEFELVEFIELVCTRNRQNIDSPT